MAKSLFRIALFFISISANAQYTKLLEFTGANGFEPDGSLFFDGTFLYGMTSRGGANNMGTIFKVKTDGTGYLRLLDFAGATNGSIPYGSLFSDGTFLYGMTSNGGANGNGTIFKIMPDGSNFAKIFDFSSTTSGRSPHGSLISDGTFLYGMTLNGGTSGMGTIFKILKDGSGYVKLFDFTGTADGREPYGDLLLVGTTLYGMTYSGGPSTRGTIFKIQTDGTAYSRLLNFTGYPSWGEEPFGSLVSDGTFLYGMTSGGGTSNDGTIFRIRLDIGSVSTIKNFHLDQGDEPFGSLLIIGSDLYGMTYSGGNSGTGALFKVKNDGSGYVKLHDFDIVNNGWLPNASLITDGTFLYGTTEQGNPSDGGVVFKYALPLTPTITSFAATSGPTGTVVTITGTNFSTTASKNFVNFNGWPATVTASTATSITATVPPAATTGPITVTVLGNTATSATDFTVTPGGAAIHKFDWVGPLSGSLDNFLNGMTIDPSGNVYTVGGFSETTDLDPGPGEQNFTSAGNFDCYISKYDPQGGLEWAFSFGGVNLDNGTEVASDADGNIYVTGTIGNSDVDLDPGPGTTILPGAFTGFVCKYDTDGNLVWARPLDSNLVSGVDILIAPSNEIYLTGGFTNTIDFDPGAGVFNMTSAGSSDAYVLKLTSDGDFVWARRVGGTLGEFSRGVAVDASGNVHLSGYFTGTVDFDPGTGTANLTAPTTASDVFILKLNSAGDYIWAKSVGSTGTSFDAADAIDVDLNGNVLVTGSFNGGGDFDPGAAVSAIASEGGSDIFILKLNASGNLVWVRSVGGSGGDVGYRIKTDAAGNVFYSGWYGRTVDFDPGPASYFLTASTGVTINDHAFVSKLDPDGNFIWAWTTSGVPALAEVPLLALDQNEDIILAGTFEFGTVTFDASNCKGSVTAGVSVSSFITKLSTNPGTSSCSPTIVFDTQPSSTSTCGETVTFTVVASGDDNLSYQWQIDDSGFVDLSDDATYSGVNTATLTIPNPSSLNGSVYRVVVHGDNTTDTPSSSVTLTVGTDPAPPIVSDPDPVCPAENVDLVASGSTDGNYRWYDGTTLINGEVNGTYVVTVSTSKTYSVSIDDGTCESAKAEIVVTLAQCTEPTVAVYNAVSPNGDGKNDVFYIENIEALESTRENKVVIYNRWGDVVYEADNYDNDSVVFSGLSKGGKELPSGTYYYRIEFPQNDSLTGYISLKR